MRWNLQRFILSKSFSRNIYARFRPEYKEIRKEMQLWEAMPSKQNFYFCLK
jgi:hypothetical protein